MWYAESLKKYTNTVDGTFYDAITFNILYIIIHLSLIQCYIQWFSAGPFVLIEAAPWKPIAGFDKILGRHPRIRYFFQPPL